MRRVLGLAMVSFLLLSQPAWAVRTPIHDAAESPNYGRKFGGMIGRGLLNVATSFVDILVNIVNESKAGPPLVGTLTGVAKGVGCGTLRLGSGAIDLVGFWVPGFNGVPVSDSYENCLAVSPSSSMKQLPAGYGNAPAPSWEMPAPESSVPSQVSPQHTDVMPTTPAQPSRKRTWKK